MTAGDRAEGVDRIEQLITELVQRAPIAESAVVDELIAALQRAGFHTVEHLELSGGITQLLTGTR